jgi:sugar phosphate isomerase/epimerase
MKMSCLPVSLFPDILGGKMTVKEYAALCKELALDGFDLGIILLKNHTPRYLQEFNSSINEENIPLVMLTTYPDFTHPDSVQREREFDFLVHDIALASAVNAKFLRVTAGQAHPGVKEKDAVDLPVYYLSKAAKVADKYGVQLVFENHSTSKGWYYMDVSNVPRIFIEIVNQLNDTSIGVNFDTANVLVSGEDNTIDVLEQVITKVKTIHVADTSSKGKMDPVQLGTGVVPMKEIFSYLRSKQFDGWLCLEIWKDEGIESIRKAVSYVKNTWEQAR